MLYLYKYKNHLKDVFRNNLAIIQTLLLYDNSYRHIKQLSYIYIKGIM